MSIDESAKRMPLSGDGAIIVETCCLRAAFGTTHAVEVDERGTALRVLCGTVPLEDIGLTRHGVPTCPHCVRVDALPVRCPPTSPRWLALELRRIAAEPWKSWYDAKENAVRDAETQRAEAECALAAAAQEERERKDREKKEEQRAWSRWKHAQHLSLSAREREWAESLRRDWAQHGQEEEKEEPIHSAPGDCGRKHLSAAAAFACRNVRLEEEERRAREARAARAPTPAARLPSESSVAPRQPTANSSPLREQIERVPPASAPRPARPMPTPTALPVMSSSMRPTRPVPTPTAPPVMSSSMRPTRPVPTPTAPPVMSSSPRPARRVPRPAASPSPMPASNISPAHTRGPALVPATSSSTQPAQPTPAPHLRLVGTSASRPLPASTGPEPPVNRTEALERRILDAVRTHDLSSYRAILTHVGGNRAAALAAIQAMHDDGRIRLDGGVFRPGERAGKRVSR
jgi:hypothetical protein